MEQNPPLITLTTDFGLTDPYVGQLKGALLSHCPTASLIDLTHAIPAWNLLAAAITLHSSYRFFPRNTVHLIVVDPGVGSARAIVAAQGQGHWFVCPDNGILSLLLDEGVIEAAFAIKPAISGAVSPTFHGRDCMAPVAAALALGTPVGELGEAMALAQLQRLPSWQAQPTVQGWQGRVLGIDHFGNLRTSIRAQELQGFKRLEINGRSVQQLVATYSEIAADTLALLVDSCGFVEIAANQADAASQLGAAVGNQVTVHCVHPPHHLHTIRRDE